MQITTKFAQAEDISIPITYTHVSMWVVHKHAIWATKLAIAASFILWLRRFKLFLFIIFYMQLDHGLKAADGIWQSTQMLRLFAHIIRI